jgi:DNA-directed RNA polymerase subunit omega
VKTKMSYIPIEKYKKQVPSIYKLVVLASKRAQELHDGAVKLVDFNSRRMIDIALEEIRQGKIIFREKPKIKTKEKEKEKSK